MCSQENSHAKCIMLPNPQHARTISTKIFKCYCERKDNTMCFHTPTCKREPFAKHPKFWQNVTKWNSSSNIFHFATGCLVDLSKIRETNVKSIPVKQGKSVTHNGKRFLETSALPCCAPWPNVLKDVVNPIANSTNTLLFKHKKPAVCRGQVWNACGNDELPLLP